MQQPVTNNRIAAPKAQSVEMSRRWAVTALAACLASGTLLMPAASVRAQGTGVDPRARAMLPEAMRTSGVLHAGMEINYAPYQYQVGGKAEGLDADLIRAIGAKLGLKPEFAFVDFAAILPAVQSGRFDIGANFANSAARRKIVTFFNYLRFADGLLVSKADSHKLDVKNLCGLRIAAGVGSFQYTNATKMREQCVKDGKPPITVVALSPTDAINALRTGRVDAEEDDAIAVFYAAGQPGNQDLEAIVLPTVVGAGNLGYITNKDADGAALARAMAAALDLMIKNGEYATILRKWNVPEELWLKEASVD